MRLLDCITLAEAHFGPHESSKQPSMRIGIANDMGLAREALRRVVLSSPLNEVSWMAKDGAEAHNKAQQFGEAYIVKDETLTTMEGEPLEESFVGIRKIIEISNPFSPGPDSAIPVDGAEITYSYFKVKDEQALADLLNGDEVLISYLE